MREIITARNKFSKIKKVPTLNARTKFVSRLTKAQLTPPEKHRRLFAIEIGLPNICRTRQCRRSGKCCGRQVHCMDDFPLAYLKRRAALYRPNPRMAGFL